MTELVRTYLSTGTIPEAEKLLTDEKFNTLSLFCKVFGTFYTGCSRKVIISFNKIIFSFTKASVLRPQGSGGIADTERCRRC